MTEPIIPKQARTAAILQEIAERNRNCICIGENDEYIDKQTIYKNQIKMGLLVYGLLADRKLTIEEANSMIDKFDLTQEIDLAAEYNRLYG